MSRLIITKSLLDDLADSISTKSGEPTPMTIEEMTDAVDGIVIPSAGTEGTPTATKGTVSNHSVSVTPSVTNIGGVIQGGTHTGTAVSVSASELVSGTLNVTSSGTKDVTNYASASVPTAGATTTTWDDAYSTSEDQRKWRNSVQVTRSNSGWIHQGSTYYYSDYYNAVPANTTVTPTESSQTIGGADYMMEGAVTVNAISSNYVGSGITRRDSTDLSASGATVSVPSGYYASNASKAVSSGTEGTPTATKGTVSNHSVSVTPSVTNTTGYITGGTKTGTAVTVSASELVSGSETKTANGTYNVTNLASLVVDIPFSTIYTGSSNPSASTGSNGDIYLKVVS